MIRSDGLAAILLVDNFVVARFNFAMSRLPYELAEKNGLEVVHGVFGRNRPDSTEGVFNSDRSLEKSEAGVNPCHIRTDF